MDFNPEPYNILQGLLYWGILFGVLLGVILLVSLIVSLVLHRGRGFEQFRKQTARLAKETLQSSPRRIWALSVLTFRESWRRKVLLVGVVFAVLFMFAGWFLSDTDARPAMQVKVHVSFVLTTITFIVLPVMLLLACWGLPEDIKARSLHTVVTKPARRHEVYLGRIFGFALIGSLFLAVMGAVGYVWIVRQVPERAHAYLIARVPVHGELSFLDRQGRPQKRGINVGDIWEFRSYIGGGSQARAIWTFDNVRENHLVPLRDEETGEIIRDADGKPVNVLKLESNFEVFRTHKGNQRRGVMCDVQIVRNHRQQTARALGSASGFELVNESLLNSDFTGAATQLQRISNGLSEGLIPFTAQNFRRVKDGYRTFAEIMAPFAGKFEQQDRDAGWIRETVAAAQLCSEAADNENAAELADALKRLGEQFRNHEAALKEMLVDLAARVKLFEVREYRETAEIDIRRKVQYRVNYQGELQSGDLFGDLIHGNKLTVHVACVDPGQFIGMAQPDLFIRLPDRHFAVSYSKAILGIWLMMLLVVILGVTASCFLKGPVATLLVFVFIILGSPFHNFLEKVVKGELKSAGAFESAYRLVNHLNPTVGTGDYQGKDVLENIDRTLLIGLKGVYRIIPDFDNYRVIPYVANGFDVPWDAALLPAVVSTLGYLIPCLLLGYVSLASRELEEK